MKFTMNNIESSFPSLLSDVENVSEYALLTTLKADISIRYGDRELCIDDVEVLRFYLDLKDAFCEVIVRGVPTALRVQYEEIIDLLPDGGGCIASDPQPPYPVDSSNLVQAHVSLTTIRSIIFDLEADVRAICEPHRREISSMFDRTQSRAMFEILRAIDNASSVRGNE